MIQKTTENKLSSNYIKIPTIGVIFFSLLLAATSFAAGASWIRSKNTSTTTPANSNLTAKTIFAAEKSEKPELKFFVMSFCPYGNQIEDALKPVAELLSKKADIRPQYIFNKVDNLANYCKQSSGDPAQCATYVQNKYFTTEAECKSTIANNLKQCQDEKNYIKSTDGTLYSSLHGRQEANQNVREICAWNLTDDKTKWWNFIDKVNKNCTSQNADSCWSDQAKQAGFDTDKITECFNKDGVALIGKEIEATDKYQAYSSPTVIVNGVSFPPESAWTQDGSGTIGIGKKVFSQTKYRSPDTLKEAVCASFKNSPSECNKTLADIAQAGAPAAGGCN